jgi:hypothetical protein
MSEYSLVLQVSAGVAIAEKSINKNIGRTLRPPRHLPEWAWVRPLISGFVTVDYSKTSMKPSRPAVSPLK